MEPIERIRSGLRSLAWLPSKFPSLKADMAIALLHLARANDGMFMLVPEKDKGKSGELFRYGWHQALLQLAGYSRAEHDFSLPPTHRELDAWADTMIQYFGYVSLLELILNWERDGLVEVVPSGDSLLRVCPKSRYQGIEFAESLDFEWYRRWLDDQVSNVHQTQSTTLRKIQKRMRRLVSLSTVEGLRYPDDRDVDSYYQSEAALHVRSRVGYDAFPSDVKLGGRRWHLYQNAVRALTYRALRHFGYYTSAMREQPHINQRFLITLLMSEDDAVRALSKDLGIDDRSAQGLLEIVTLRSQDVGPLLSPGPVHPPLIDLGNGWILFSMAGILGEPFDFVMRKLENRYSGEYVKRRMTREGVFREDLYSLLSKYGQLSYSLAGVPLRLPGQNELTDIDAVVFDKETRTLALFQLKWQDPFGQSMRMRRSRMSHLATRATRWVKAVSKWIDEQGPDSIVQAAKIEHHGERVERVLLFALGRLYSQFSGDVAPEEGATWGNWYQVHRLANTDPLSELDPLGDLHSRLVVNAPCSRNLINGFEVHVRFEGTRIFVDPVRSRKNS